MQGIGDFARSVGLSVSAVRFYADRGLLTPAHVDGESGYRWFHPEQVATGCLIRDLRRINLSLSEIERALLLPTDELAVLVDEQIARLAAGVATAKAIAAGLGAAPPVAGDTPSVGETVVDADELCLAFEQVLPFSGTDPEAPHLMTVLLEIKGGSVRLAATDTHRLVVRDIVPIKPGGDASVLLAAATVRLLLPDLGGEGQLSIRADGLLRLLAGGDSSDGARTINAIPASFPDYDRVLTPPTEAQTATSIVMIRSSMLAALEQFSGRTPVVLSTTTDGLRLSRGDRLVDVPAEVAAQQDSVTVALDPAYADQCVRGAIGAEIVMEVEADPIRPVVFRSATDGTYAARLMPVTLD